MLCEPASSSSSFALAPPHQIPPRRLGRTLKTPLLILTLSSLVPFSPAPRRYRKRAAEEEAEEASKRAKKSQKAAEAHRKDIDVFGGDLQVIVPQTGEGTRAVLEDVPGGAMGDGAGEED